MKNGIRKIIAIGLGVCFLALWFAFLFFVVTKPYTEKIVIWLPDNYELENYVKDEIISIIPKPIDNSHQSDKVFYSQIGMESFKRLFGNSEKGVSVRIEDTGYSKNDYYQIIYQTKFDCADKSFIVIAQDDYPYNKRTLSEMRLSQNTLFLENKRDKFLILFFLILVFVVIAIGVCLYTMCLDILSKKND